MRSYVPQAHTQLGIPASLLRVSAVVKISCSFAGTWVNTVEFLDISNLEFAGGTVRAIVIQYGNHDYSGAQR